MTSSLTKFNIEYEMILPGWDEFGKVQFGNETIFAYCQEEAEDIFYRLYIKHYYIIKTTKGEY